MATVWREWTTIASLGRDTPVLMEMLPVHWQDRHLSNERHASLSQEDQQRRNAWLCNGAPQLENDDLDELVEHDDVERVLDEATAYAKRHKKATAERRAAKAARKNQTPQAQAEATEQVHQSEPEADPTEEQDDEHRDAMEAITR
jgi:hypothetical protein